MKKIVIVGGGVAGLSAGIYARKAGYEVEIYEKHSVVGGLCTGWSRKGFFIDNCVHWLTGTKKKTPLYKLWEDLGVLGDDIEIIQPEDFYSAELNGEKVTLWKDLDRTEKEMLALSPEDEEEIRKFIAYIRIAESLQMPIDMPMDMMKPWEIISLGRSMKGMSKVMKEYGKSNIEELANRFKHPLLKCLMMDYMAKEYVAYSLLVSYAMLTSGNGGIPRGGSLKMAHRMRTTFEALGGKVYTNTNVAKIELENDTNASGIILSDGTIVRADYIICACDVDFIFSQLLDKKYMDKKMQNTYEDHINYPVNSGFQVAFAVDGTFEEVSDMLFFHCRDLKIGTQITNRMGIKNYSYETTFAPEGKTVIQSNSIQYENDYDYWKKLYENKGKYKDTKENIAKEILKRIEEKFPQYNGKLEVLDVWTPVTYNRYCNTYYGSYMSFIMTKYGANTTFKGSIKDLENVFIASQWLMGPGGLPVAAAMGKFSIQRILKKEKKSINI